MTLRADSSYSPGSSSALRCGSQDRRTRTEDQGMVASDSFAEFLREQLAPLGRVTMRRMFGKTGVFCHRPLLLARAGGAARTRCACHLGASGAGGGAPGRGEERTDSAKAKIKAQTQKRSGPSLITAAIGPALFLVAERRNC